MEAGFGAVGPDWREGAREKPGAERRPGPPSWINKTSRCYGTPYSSGGWVKLQTPVGYKHARSFSLARASAPPPNRACVLSTALKHRRHHLRRAETPLKVIPLIHRRAQKHA